MIPTIRQAQEASAMDLEPVTDLSLASAGRKLGDAINRQIIAQLAWTKARNRWMIANPALYRGEGELRTACIQEAHQSIYDNLMFANAALAQAKAENETLLARIGLAKKPK